MVIADFTYIQCADGFIAIAPNTFQAEQEYNRMFSETGGVRLMPHEFKGFKAAARKAGYSVRKSVKGITDDIKAGRGRPPKLFICNQCRSVLGSAAVRSHKCHRALRTANAFIAGKRITNG